MNFSRENNLRSRMFVRCGVFFFYRGSRMFVRCGVFFYRVTYFFHVFTCEFFTYFFRFYV